MSNCTTSSRPFQLACEALASYVPSAWGARRPRQYVLTGKTLPAEPSSHLKRAGSARAEDLINTIRGLAEIRELQLPGRDERIQRVGIAREIGDIKNVKSFHQE